MPTDPRQASSAATTEPPEVTIRRALALTCEGCTYDSKGRISVSPRCAVHGDALAAQDALNRLLAENERLREKLDEEK